MAARTHEVTRLEGFSDAVFGFAVTLLVVSFDTPDRVSDLVALSRGFAPFALTFAMVSWIWYEHNVFFRRYGLQDPWTVFLNAVLLFVVLFYVYPLKFLAIQIVNLITSSQTHFGDTLPEARWLMLVYSGGVVLIFGCFVMLYRHAWRRRTLLGLSARDEVVLRFGQRSHVISMGLGLASLALATLVSLIWPDPHWISLAGFIYILMGPLHAWNGFRGGAALARLDAQARPLAATTPTAPAGDDPA